MENLACPCDGKKCKLTIQDSRHQSTTGYHAGCRCDLCKKSNLDYKQAQIAAVLTDPNHKYHGTTAGYACKCRCDACREAHRGYYASRKDKVSTYYAERYLSHKAEITERNRRYAEANPDRGREKSRRRRVRILNGVVEKFTELEIFERDNWICQICLVEVDKTLPFPMSMSKSLDHIIPVAKGGSHTRENVRLAHLVCNMRKGDKLG